MKLGDKMKEIRLKNNLKQREVAEKMTVSTSYVCRVEHNQEMPTAMYISLFCFNFGIDKENLLGGDECVANSKPSSRLA